VWCGLLNDHLIGPFFFTKATVTSRKYLDMLEKFVYPQLQELRHAMFCQQDGAPPYWSLTVYACLNQEFPNQ
jgi:hypothetical protein